MRPSFTIKRKKKGYLRMISKNAMTVGCATALIITAMATVLRAQSSTSPVPPDVEKAVLNRLAEIQTAAQALDPDRVFSFVLENDKGSLVQDGELFLTRKEALQSTKRGFRDLQEVDYQFDQQHVTLLAPTVALVTGDGLSSATTQDGRKFSTRFAQSVILVLTEGQWKVFHAHRSFPRAN